MASVLGAFMLPHQDLSGAVTGPWPGWALPHLSGSPYIFALWQAGLL